MRRDWAMPANDRTLGNRGQLIAGMSRSYNITK